MGCLLKVKKALNCYGYAILIYNIPKYIAGFFIITVKLFL